MASCGGRCGDHGDAIGEPAGADADDVRLLLRQHVAVVCIELRHAEAFSGGGEAGGVGIGHGDDLETFQILEGGVQPVAVVTTAGGADDADAKFLHGGLASKEAQISASSLCAKMGAVAQHHFGGAGFGRVAVPIVAAWVLKANMRGVSGP